MSAEILPLGLLGAGVAFLIAGIVLAIIAGRIASSGRAARAEADIRLAASQELAAEVKRLAEKVEASLEQRDAAIENAFLRHNDACAASMRAQMSGEHDDDDDDHHHHAADGIAPAGAGVSGDLSGDLHDDDDDDHQHHHAGEETAPSFLARLFGRGRKAA